MSMDSFILCCPNELREGWIFCMCSAGRMIPGKLKPLLLWWEAAV